MPAAKATDPADLQRKPLKSGDRVVVTADLRGVPEGTAGRVKTTAGLTWPRYWVEFSNGKWVGSVSQSLLVRERDWDRYQRLREEERSRPKVEAPAGDASNGEAVAAAGGEGGPASRVPAHLLERSRKARERLAGG